MAEIATSSVEDPIRKAARRGSSGAWFVSTAHFGADVMKCNDIAAFLRGQSRSLPVSILDAMEAGIAAIALDQAPGTGQILDLTEVWARRDSDGLRG